MPCRWRRHHSVCVHALGVRQVVCENANDEKEWAMMHASVRNVEELTPAWRELGNRPMLAALSCRWQR